MVTIMRMECKLKKDANGYWCASGKMYDGTSFEVPGLSGYDVIFSDPQQAKHIGKGVTDGWLIVKREALQHDRAYLTLPQATLPHGHQIVVNKRCLTPMNATLKDFNPKTTTAVVAEKPA